MKLCMKSCLIHLMNGGFWSLLLVRWIIRNCYDICDLLNLKWTRIFYWFNTIEFVLGRNRLTELKMLSYSVGFWTTKRFWLSNNKIECENSVWCATSALTMEEQGTFDFGLPFMCHLGMKYVGLCLVHHRCIVLVKHCRIGIWHAKGEPSACVCTLFFYEL